MKKSKMILTAALIVAAFSGAVAASTNAFTIVWYEDNSGNPASVNVTTNCVPGTIENCQATTPEGPKQIYTTSSLTTPYSQP